MAELRLAKVEPIDATNEVLNCSLPRFGVPAAQSEVAYRQRRLP